MQKIGFLWTFNNWGVKLLHMPPIAKDSGAEQTVTIRHNPIPIKTRQNTDQQTRMASLFHSTYICVMHTRF